MRQYASLNSVLGVAGVEDALCEAAAAEEAAQKPSLYRRALNPNLQYLLIAFHLLSGRLEDVRREAAAAEQRAHQLAAEVRAATEALNARTDAYNKAVSDFFKCAPALCVGDSMHETRGTCALCVDICMPALSCMRTT